MMRRQKGLGVAGGVRYADGRNRRSYDDVDVGLRMGAGWRAMRCRAMLRFSLFRRRRAVCAEQCQRRRRGGGEVGQCQKREVDGPRWQL